MDIISYSKIKKLLGIVELKADKGKPNGYASLDATGNVPASQLANASGGGGVKNNYNATIDPTVNDDSEDGYSVRSTWINITLDTAYVCLDTTTGAAKWEKISGLASHEDKKMPHDNIPYANIYLSAHKSIPNNETTKIAFNATRKDNDVMADLANHQFIIKTAGTYLLYGMVSFAINATGTRSASLFKNSILCTGNALVSVNGATTLPFLMSTPLAVNDTLDIRVHQQSGTELTLQGIGNGSRTYVSILRIGD